MATLVACARATAGHGAGDGVAVLDAPISRRSCGRYEEAEPKRRLLLAVDITGGTAPRCAQTANVDVSRFAVSGPRAVGARVR